MGAAAFGACLSMGEMLLSGGAELYAGSILMTCGIFLTAVQNPSAGRGSLLAHIGEKDSQSIYLWQIIIYDATSMLAKGLGIRGMSVYQWLMPLWVCLASWMLAEILEILERRRRI